MKVGEDEEAFGREAVACLVSDVEAGLAFPADGDRREKPQGLFDHGGGKGELVEEVRA